VVVLASNSVAYALLFALYFAISGWRPAADREHRSRSRWHHLRRRLCV